MSSSSITSVFKSFASGYCFNLSCFVLRPTTDRFNILYSDCLDLSRSVFESSIFYSDVTFETSSFGWLWSVWYHEILDPPFYFDYFFLLILLSTNKLFLFYFNYKSLIKSWLSETWSTGEKHLGFELVLLFERSVV